MESLEKLTDRIEFGRKIDNEASKIFFSLEPTLRFALVNYLIRKHGEEIPDTLFYYSDLELIKVFDEIVELDEAIYNQIFELYQAITDHRLIAYSNNNGIQNPEAKVKRNNLKSPDYYLNVMENVVMYLLQDLKSRPIAYSDAS